MKKFVSLAFALTFVMLTTLSLTACGGGASKRENVLRVYTWFDYQYNDEDGNLEDDFNAYYREKTGNSNFKIEFTYFTTVEEMLTKIESGKEDFDLACPSDYMIQHMISKDLLLPIKTETLENYGNLSPYIVDNHNEFESLSKKAGDTNTYSVSYMWGTMGSLYNVENMTEAQIESLSESWDEFLNPENKGKVLIKDSMRDTYIMASMLANKDKFSGMTAGDPAYLQLVNDVINDVSNENIKAVEAVINQMKKDVNVAFEVDEGKADIAAGKKNLDFAWSGDAIWAIMEAKNEFDAELSYVIPKIGSNVWFDGWVIPKYAANTDAAHDFIDFILQSDVAIKNMEYIGYTSGVASKEVADWICGETDNALAEDYEDEEGETVYGIGWNEDIDMSYFFANDVVADATHFKTPKYMYPSKEEINICGIMRDFGDSSKAVAQMWARMKTNSLTIILIVVGSVLGAAVIGVAVFFIVKKVKAPKKKEKKQTQAFRRDN